MERKIEVITTGQSGIIPVYTGATDWSELKTALTKAGVNYNGMKAVVGQTRVTLEHANAVLPEGEFELFLMPQKSNKGLTRNEIYAAIKEAIAAGKVNKEFFSVNGKNYTMVSSIELEQKLIELHGNVTAPSAPQPDVAEEVPVDEELEVQEETVEVQEEVPVQSPKIAKAVELLKTTRYELLVLVYEDQDEDAFESSKSNLEEAIDCLTGIIQKNTSGDVPSVEDEIHQLAIDAKAEAKERSDAAQLRARQLAAGFSDVRAD
jgi:hypothetical protein